MSTHQIRKSITRAALRTSDSATHTAVTLAARLPILMGGLLAPTPQSIQEWNQAYSEKMLAVAEGAFAAAQVWQLAMLRCAFQAPTPTGLALDCMEAVSVAMHPAQKRVKANAHRLSALKHARRSG